jgi:hypothetical protein
MSSLPGKCSASSGADVSHGGLVEEGQDGFGDEQPRPRRSGNALEPCLVEDRGADHCSPQTIDEEVAAKVDGVRQVEVDPVESAVVDAFEAGVEAGADLHNGSVGHPVEEAFDPMIEDEGAQVGAGQASDLTEPAEVVVERLHHLDGAPVAKHAVGLVGFDRPRVQRDQQGLLDDPEFHRNLAGHHVPPGSRPTAQPQPI